MAYYIFRKVDKEILYVSFTETEDASAWEACLTNEEGLEADFHRVESDLPFQAGDTPTYDAGNNISFTPNPTQAARRGQRLAARSKIKSLVPGLTDNDLDDLGLGEIK